MSCQPNVGHSPPLPAPRGSLGLSAKLLLGCALTISFLAAKPQAASAAPRRIFIGFFAKNGDSELRKNLIKELLKSKAFQVVESPAAADVILAGTSELFVRGYYSLYVRAGSSPSHGQPLYLGYTSVELKTPSGETLWSYLATLQEATTNPSRELSHDIARHLLQSPITNSKNHNPPIK